MRLARLEFIDPIATIRSLSCSRAFYCSRTPALQYYYPSNFPCNKFAGYSGYKNPPVNVRDKVYNIAQAINFKPTINKMGIFVDI